MDKERFKKFLLGAAFGLVVVFAIALAIVAGPKLSTEATAVIVGVACGIAAGIPTCVFMMVVLARRERELAQRQKARLRYEPH